MGPILSCSHAYRSSSLSTSPAARYIFDETIMSETSSRKRKQDEVSEDEEDELQSLPDNSEEEEE